MHFKLIAPICCLLGLSSADGPAPESLSLLNPCSPEAVRQQKYYHAVSTDRRLYVQCDALGSPTLRHCAAPLVWNQRLTTCAGLDSETGDDGTVGGEGEEGGETVIREGEGEEAMDNSPHTNSSYHHTKNQTQSSHRNGYKQRPYQTQEPRQPQQPQQPQQGSYNEQPKDQQQQPYVPTYQQTIKSQYNEYQPQKTTPSYSQPKSQPQPQNNQPRNQQKYTQSNQQQVGGQQHYSDQAQEQYNQPNPSQYSSAGINLPHDTVYSEYPKGFPDNTLQNGGPLEDSNPTQSPYNTQPQRLPPKQPQWHSNQQQAKYSNTAPQPIPYSSNQQSNPSSSSSSSSSSFHDQRSNENSERPVAVNNVMPGTSRLSSGSVMTGSSHVVGEGYSRAAAQPPLMTRPTPDAVSASVTSGADSPCSHPNVRYIPRYGEPSRYFECIQGRMTERSCAWNEVWNQEAAGGGACVRSDSGLSYSMCAGATTSDGTANGPRPRRFMPYTGDASKYIECIPERRAVAVRRCTGTSEIWVQSLERCAPATNVTAGIGGVSLSTNQTKPVTAVSSLPSNQHPLAASDSVPRAIDYRPRAAQPPPPPLYRTPSYVASGYSQPIAPPQVAPQNPLQAPPPAQPQAPPPEYSPQPPPTDQYSNGNAKNMYNHNYYYGPDSGMVGQTRPVFTGVNPCLSQTSLYFPFPGVPGYFIQCDTSGNMFVQPCPTSLIWDQTILTCTYPPLRQMEPGAGGGGGGEDEGTDFEKGHERWVQKSVMYQTGPSSSSSSSYSSYKSSLSVSDGKS